MSLYNEIKNPINEYTLLRLMKIYADTRESYYPRGSMYSKLIGHSNYEKKSSEEMIENFNNYIKYPNINILIHNLKNIDFTKMDKLIKESLEEEKKRNNSDVFFSLKIQTRNRYLYPLRDIYPVIKTFKSYAEFEKFYENMDMIS